MSDIWTNYPPELITAADDYRAEADAKLLTQPPLDPDPYNISFSELLKRWWQRKKQGN